MSERFEVATPLFIMGKHRSGNTFLANLLLSHPKIAGIHYSADSDISRIGMHESAFFNRIEGRYGDLRNFENYVEFAAVMSKSEYFILANVSFEELMRYFGADYHVVFREVMDRYAAEHNAAYWMEKSPSNALHARRLKRYYPDAKFIGIVRDEVDVALSSLHLKKKQHESRLTRLKVLITVAVLKYIYDVSMTKMKNAYPQSVLIIKYTELVEHQDRLTDKICDFLGLERDKLSTRYVKNTSFSVSKEKKSYGYERFLVRVFYRYVLKLFPCGLLSILNKKLDNLSRRELPGWFFRSQKR
jgi:hypothetical protein